MIEYITIWLQLKTDRRAVTALEYGLIAAIMSSIIIAVFATLGTSLGTAFTKIGGELTK